MCQCALSMRIISVMWICGCFLDFFRVGCETKKRPAIIGHISCLMTQSWSLLSFCNNSAGTLAGLSSVEIYNLATDTVTQGTPLPVMTYAITLSQIDGVLYSFGGASTRGKEVYVLDEDEATWKKTPRQLSESMHSVKVVVYNAFVPWKEWEHPWNVRNLNTRLFPCFQNII